MLAIEEHDALVHAFIELTIAKPHLYGKIWVALSKCFIEVLLGTDGEHPEQTSLEALHRSSTYKEIRLWATVSLSRNSLIWDLFDELA